MDQPDPPAPPAPVLPAPPPGGPWRAFWHLLQPVLAVLLLLGLVGGALGGVAVWLLRSAEGTAWLLARLPGLEVQGTEGALLSDAFAAERIVVRWDGGQQSVRVDALRARGLQWSWHPARGAWIGLRADSITAQRVDVQTGPASPRPIQMPRSLQMPLLLQAQRAEVAELQIEALPPMTSVQADRVRLWQPDGAYQADAVAFDWERAHVEGTVSFGALPPYQLQAQVRLRERDEPGRRARWAAEARAAGPLAAFELRATLRGQPGGKGAPPALDVDTTVTPLEAWPLGRLQLQTRALDLAALSSKAPRTALSGHMDIDTRSYAGPVAATIELDNALPGSWDQGRLPVRRLQARLRSPDRDRSRLLIEDFDLQLAREAEGAGRWRGAGHWTGHRLQLDTTIEALRPKLLDSRAAVMQLSGSLGFTLAGLPSPDPTAPPAAPRGLTLELRTQLEGLVAGSPHPVKLAVDASVDAEHVELRELRAEAGSARAALALAARRAPGQTWQLRSSGTLSDFDPLPWWPGREDSAWRAGQHRLSGSWALDLQLPRLQPDMAPLALAQGVAGSGTLHVERSLIAGVPVALHAELGRPGGAGAPSTVRGEVVLDGNRLSLDGQGQPLGDGRNDRLRFELQAPALAKLAPLARLVPDLAGWAPRAGKADATLSLEGRWPDIRSEGQATLLAVQVGTLEARQAQASWRFDTASDQPLLLQAEAQGLVQGGRRLEQLNVDLRGTWRQHRLDLSAALPAQPPAGLQQMLGLRTAAGTLAQMRADGQWASDGNGGGLWSGRIAQLTLGPWSGSTAPLPVAPGSVWLDGRDLRAQVRFDARDGLSELQAAAGQVRLAEAVTLRWDEVRADLRGKDTAFALRADIEPFALAPLLARAQPSMGWSGDLRLAARVDLKVGDKVDAELVFERRDGDLRLAEENASQPFGLSELRLVASAHDGHWQVGAAFAGKTLGEAAARLNLRPRPDQRWPTADTPIDGLIEGHVANLGVWGSWVPPGWRLSGELRTSASVGGRIGAPDYAGEVRASKVGVRNLLLGVDVREGEALVRLKGARAEIERFTLQGGEGQLRVSGSARLDEEPSAALTLDAERFRVLGRVDRQLMASGRLQVELSEAALAVNGKVHIDEGLFDLGRSDAPALDDDVTIRQARPDVESAAPALPQRPRRRQQVAIAIDLGEQLHVRGRGLDTTLRGDLRLGSSAGRLTLNGIVSAAGGSYAAYGQKLDIERGLLIFSGDIEAPVLDVLALRPNLDMQVGVAITGSLYSPRVRLYASSDMSESDKLSWLVLGRASEGLGRADTALLQRAAVALLAGEGEAPTDALLRNLGIDQLSLRQSDTDVRETVVSLGKQLSRRWYVGYERGVNATTGTWQLIYRIAQRFTLRAQSGLENSLDLIWVWRLQDPEPAAPPMPKSPAAKPP